jgi:hypothetical protein
MTPRLKILSVGLAFSIIYSVYDWYGRNDIGKPKTNQVVKKKSKNDRPKTAKSGRGRAANRAMANAAKAKDQKRNQEMAGAELTQVSNEINELQGWSRNPFISAAEPIKMRPRSVIKEPVIVDQTDQSEQSIPALVIEKDELSGVDNLNIETIARVGQKVFVIINGQRLKEGDLINNLLIESIDNQKITFKMGNTTIIKDVGS